MKNDHSSYLETLLAIVALGHKAYSRWLFQRLLPRIIVVAGLIIITAIMVSATLFGGLYATFFMLLYYGIQPPMAIAITSGLALAIITILVTITLACLKHVRVMPQTMLKKSPLTSRAMDVLDAFTKGLMED